MDDVVRYFLVTGKVQGVFFRQSARREAQRLGVHGSARNLPDGSVEVWARGSMAALDALCAWLKQGPPQARVDAVRESRSGMVGKPPQIPEGFEVF
jgi:acylphosphatase